MSVRSQCLTSGANPFVRHDSVGYACDNQANQKHGNQNQSLSEGVVHHADRVSGGLLAELGQLRGALVQRGQQRRQITGRASDLPGGGAVIENVKWFAARGSNRRVGGWR